MKKMKFNNKVMIIIGIISIILLVGLAVKLVNTRNENILIENISKEKQEIQDHINILDESIIKNNEEKQVEESEDIDKISDINEVKKTSNDKEKQVTETYNEITTSAKQNINKQEEKTVKKENKQQSSTKQEDTQQSSTKQEDTQQSSTQNENIQQPSTNKQEETKVENKVEEKKEETIRCTNINNHAMGVGNTGKWFSSQNEAVAYYESQINYWSEWWENAPIGEDYDKKYYANCPTGYEVWDCMYCSKWTINFYYR